MGNARRRTQRTNRTAARSTVTRTTGAGVAVFEGEDARMGRTIDWQSEYKYISTDLRQLLIVSVILFALLFTAGFFLA